MADDASLLALYDRPPHLPEGPQGGIDGLRLRPRSVRPEELERANAEEQRKGARKFEPFRQSAERMEATRKPSASRIFSWLLHPDERVPIHLLDRHVSFLGGNRSRTYFLLRVLIARSLSDADRRGETWTPVLDALSRRLVDVSSSPQPILEGQGFSLSSGTEPFRLMDDEPLGLELNKEEGFDLAAWLGSGFATDEARAWADHFKGYGGSGERSPGGRHTRTPRDLADRLSHLADALLHAAGRDPERLQPLTSVLSPLVWTAAAKRMRLLRETDSRLPSGEAVPPLSSELSRTYTALFVDGGADRASFAEPFVPPHRSGPTTPDERIRHAERSPAQMRELFGVLLPRVAQDLEVELDGARELALSTSSASRRSDVLWDLGERFSESVTRRRSRQAYGSYRRRSTSYVSPSGDPTFGTPLSMEGELSRETVEEVVRVLERMIREVSDKASEPLAHLRPVRFDLLRVMPMLGGDVTASDLDRLVEAAGKARAGRSPSRAENNFAVYVHDMILRHPSRSPELFLRILDRNRSPGLRIRIAEDPLVTESPEVRQRVARATPEARRALLLSLRQSGASTDEYASILRSLCKDSPHTVTSMLESDPTLGSALGADDVARLMASSDPDVREKAFVFLSDLDVTPNSPESSRQRALSR